jgi:serine/threonine protein kinase
MVHSDLKPANLVVVQGGVKIIDFGIAKRCGTNTTAIHREDNTGTVNYMSPEAISGTGVHTLSRMF